MMTFNLSPDTVSFVSKEVKKTHDYAYDLELMPLDQYMSMFKFEDKGDSIYFTFPDKDELEIRLITVSIKKSEGFLVTAMKELYDKRQALKAIYVQKKARNEDWHLEFSRQYMYKTQINSIYGIQGAEFSYFAEYLIGPTVTAFGRYLITLVEMALGKETICEIDTDGLYSTKESDVEKINREINCLLEQNMPGLIKKTYIETECDKYLKGYFYKSKNYILEDTFHNLKIKGNSMKSSRNCKIVNDAFKKIIQSFFVEEKSIYVIAKELLNFSNYKLKDFALKVSVKDKHSYKGKNCLSVQLIDKLQKSTGEVPGNGRQIYYIISKDSGNKYIPLELVSNARQIDISYYENEIFKVLERFGYDREVAKGQVKLDVFLT